jgi:hypothetical protein
MIPVVTVEHADAAALSQALDVLHDRLSGAVWRSPTRDEVARVVDGAGRLVMALDRCDAGPLSVAAAALGPDWTVEAHRAAGTTWVVVFEASPRGGPLSAWRCGEAVELVVQAPHSHFDLRTGALARDGLLGAPVRGAMWNTTHRYRAIEGERPEDPVHPADVATQPASLFQAWSVAAAAVRPVRFVQLHGFGRGPGDAVLSSGDAARPPTALAPTVAAEVGAVSVYGVDAAVLGGTENVLGRALPGRFLHLELGADARARLAAAPDRLAALLRALGEAAWGF